MKTVLSQQMPMPVLSVVQHHQATSTSSTLVSRVMSRLTKPELVVSSVVTLVALPRFIWTTATLPVTSQVTALQRTEPSVHGWAATVLLSQTVGQPLPFILTRTIPNTSSVTATVLAPTVSLQLEVRGPLSTTRNLKTVHSATS